MEKVTLKSKSESGQELAVTYAPEKGMNMVSYRKGEIEIVDQSTKPDFEKRFAGLGALIGPHFYRRNPKTLSPLKDASLFPHIAYAKEAGDTDPFTHGIGRYAPWNYETKEDSIHATLKGDDLWHNIPLKELEGQNFKMEFRAKLHAKGLKINLSVVSDKESIVGTHYYYHLPRGSGKVIAGVQNEYYDPNVKREIPKDWLEKGTQTLCYQLNQNTDFAFHPHPDSTNGQILLDAIDYKLAINYTAPSAENAFQVYHPAGASFVCIEPCSALDPRHANLTVSSIEINLEILD